MRDPVKEWMLWFSLLMIAVGDQLMSAVSACETDRGFSGTEEFWIIVAIRSEDETETRAGESAGRADRQRHPARDAPTFFG